jgi:hypothetical protein
MNSLGNVVDVSLVHYKSVSFIALQDEHMVVKLTARDGDTP